MVAVRRQLPEAPATVTVPGTEGLAAGDGASVWRHLRANCPNDGDVPRIGCFASTRNASFLGVTVQVLLRLPAVALWLTQHVAVCDLDRCFICALWRSRSSLGSGRGSEVPALLAQLGHADFFEAFCDGRSHSAADFLREYLLTAVYCEESECRNLDSRVCLERR